MARKNSLTNPFQNCTDKVLVNVIRYEKECKGIQIRQEETKLIFCRWHGYLEKLKHSIKNIPRNKWLSKVVDEVNIQKSINYLCINNK